MSTSSVEGAREALASLPALAHLSGDARRLVEDSFVAVSYPFGSVIVREGDPADAFYVLVAGSARVVKRGEGDQEVPLNRLGPGDGFGELALIEGGSRSATVRASSEVHALRLDRSVFAALERSDPEIRAEFELQVRHHHLRDFLRVHSTFGAAPGDCAGAADTRAPPALVRSRAGPDPRGRSRRQPVHHQGGPPPRLPATR